MPLGALAVPLIGAAAGVGTALIKSGAQNRATDKSIQAQTAASQSADQTSLRIAREAAARQEPFRQLGLSAIKPYSELLGLDNPANQNQPQAQAPVNAFSQYRGVQPTPNFGGGRFNVGGNAFRKQAGGLSIDEGRYGGEQLGPDSAINASASGQVPNFSGYNQGDFDPRGGFGNAFSGFQAEPQPAQGQYGGIKAPANDVVNIAGGQPVQGNATQNAFDRLRSRPGFEFQLDQGNRALDASAASRGMIMSGQQIKAATKFGQDYGSNAYDKELARLSTVITGGQYTTNAVNASEQNAGNQIANNALNLGRARASAYQQQGQNSANTIGSIAGAVGGGFGAISERYGWT